MKHDLDRLRDASRRHYDAHPFDFIEGEPEIASVQPPPFRAFVERYVGPGDAVLDVGCGPGRALAFLQLRSDRVFGCDLSSRSLRLAAGRVPRSELVQADLCLLPYPDASFDAVCCDGVLHHTPNASKGFSELARVLRPGGKLYLSVYKPYRHYYYLYRYLGAVMRVLDRNLIGRLLLRGLFMPPYFLAHQIKARGRRSWRITEGLFQDYFLTPQATFHARSEVEGWSKDSGLACMEYYPFQGSNCHSFVFRK